MGKIILTERQYRNLNQILIGKEVENNKGRLNEMDEGRRLIAESTGKKIQYRLVQCDGEESGQWCINEMVKLLKLLKTEDEFEEASKFTSYWVDNTFNANEKWCRNLGMFLDKIEGGDKIGGATTFASYFALAGGTLSYGKTTDSAGTIILKPNSFTLSWKAAPAAAVTPAAVTPAAAPAAAPVGLLFDFNKPLSVEQITAFQRWYWSEYEKEGSAPYVSGDKNDECKAKYASALCGGRPCIRGQAVDGKMGGNTKKLITPEITEEFLNWKNANPDLLTKYSKLDKCSSSDKGYTASVKTPSSRSRRSSTGGGGGGTGGGGTGAHELSGLV